MSAAPAEAAQKDPWLPPLQRVGDLIVPKPPQDMAATQLDMNTLIDLTAKLLYTSARVDTKGVSQSLHMSMPLADHVMEQLCHEGFAEETLQTSQGLAHYKITDRGRQHAERALDACAYIGSAPVRLESYAAMLRWQFANSPPVTPEHVMSAL